MHRRNFIIGFGSIAATGVAITGTGAFTSIEANRKVSVRVAGDSSGFLALRKAADQHSDPGTNSNAFVDDSDGAVAFDFSGSNGAADLGDGFNINAVTRIDDLIAVQNRGPRSAYISVDLAGMGFIDAGGNNPYVGLAVKPDAYADSYVNENIVFNSLADNSWGGAVPDPRIDGSYELGSGESVNLDLTVDTSAVRDQIFLDSGSLAFIADRGDTIRETKRPSST